MTKIQVKWLKNASVASLTPDLLAKCSFPLRNAASLQCYSVNSDDAYWMVVFASKHIDVNLWLSEGLLEDINEQAHPMSGFGNVQASRQFLDSEEGEPMIEELNTLLRAIDQRTNKLKESEQKFKELTSSVQQVAKDLKKTRSDFISGKVRDARCRLEYLAR